MNEKKSWNGNVINRWKAVFKETIDDYIICDVYMGGAQYVNVPSELVLTLGKKRIKQYYGEEDAKIKLDTNNAKLIEKVKKLKSNQKFYVEVSYPRSGGYYNVDTWKVVEIYDTLPETKRSYLFPSTQLSKPKVQELSEKTKKQYKKDIKIAELEEENARLKSQVQLLQKQLEEKVNAN